MRITGERVAERRAELKTQRNELERQLDKVERQLSRLAVLSAASIASPAVFDRSNPTGEALAWVAHLYRWAVMLGEAPKLAIAADLGVSPATAGRWIAASRAAGHLQPDEVDPRGRIAI